MVPTRFAWPYGGHQVFLSGSFTRIINCFQAIYNLEPGYHQYKFLVDGVWRLNEQQPYVTDEHGIVNNIILVKEPELVSSVLRLEASNSDSSMELDNGFFRHPASLSGGTHRDPVLQIPDGDIHAFNSSHHVIALDIKLPVKQAFHIMYEQGLVAVPIRDDMNGQFCGMLSASDFILILMELHNNGSILTDEELETHTVLAWKEGKYQLNREPDGSVEQLPGRPLIQADPHESLKDVALKIVHNKISTVPIIHKLEDGSMPQLLHLACLPGILKHICRHFRHSPGTLRLLQQPVGRLCLGSSMQKVGVSTSSRLTMLRPNDPLSSALTLLVEDQVSSIPIVDDNGSLLDVYSRSDITSLAKDSAYAHIRLDQTSIHQALQLFYEATGAVNAYKHCTTCLNSDSLHEIMERLSDPAVRRLIVVEAGSKRVEGIISLRDVFNFLLG
ncbi:hypothetical protein MKW92_018911 [Papaver armeniacum]|nr:hypothetical protein MKW92_018911 [Papaver armeniacum]